MRAYEMNTCPGCGRVFRVVPEDDVMLPACGCYGTDLASVDEAPCEACGFAHVMQCEHFTSATRRVAHAVIEGAPIVSVNPETGAETERVL